MGDPPVVQLLHRLTRVVMMMMNDEWAAVVVTMVVTMEVLWCWGVGLRCWIPFVVCLMMWVLFKGFIVAGWNYYCGLAVCSVTSLNNNTTNTTTSNKKQQQS